MKTPRLKNVSILCCLLIFSLIMASQMQRKLIDIKVENHLVNVQALENAPPLVAFTTIALGGFRGLISDFLFIRMQVLQEKEKYFEIFQVASWIVNLQPRFTGVTTFLAWNMAYNISVMHEQSEDRWRWVQNGIELIRDHAIPLNPEDASLYGELAWFYHHKIGQILDDAHVFYKMKLAHSITKVLGDGPIYDWDSLAKIHTDYVGFSQDLGDQWETFESILREKKTTLKKLEVTFRKEGEIPVFIRDELIKLGLENRLDLFFRAKWLHETLKLNPTVIHQLIRKYGYLDFRLPEAHAIYWASMGLNSSSDVKRLTCERIIFQSLENAFLSGNLIYFDERPVVQTSPNLELVDSVVMAYHEALDKHKSSNSIVAGYGNFMANAIVILYIFGAKKKAKKFLDLTQKSAFLNRIPRYKKNLDNFVFEELGGDMEVMSPDQAQALVQALLFQSYKALMFKEYTRSHGFELLASKVYRKFMHDKRDGKDKMRRGLPDYSALKNQSKTQIKKKFPEKIFNLLEIEIEKLGAKSKEKQN